MQTPSVCAAAESAAISAVGNPDARDPLCFEPSDPPPSLAVVLTAHPFSRVRTMPVLHVRVWISVNRTVRSVVLVRRRLLKVELLSHLMVSRRHWDHMDHSYDY